ncbi:MAG: hypothetical protein ABIJ34_01065 [archaeon]
MASLLDISLLSHFSDVFVILFIFVSVYAILMVKKPFGDVKGINALMAFSVSMIFIFSRDAIEIVKQQVPWMIIFLVALMLILLLTTSIGAELPAALMSNIGTYILVIALIILVINIGLRTGQQAGPYLGGNVSPDTVVAGQAGDVGTTSVAQNFGATLFHPKVLAMLLIIIVSLFSVLLIGYWV